MRYFFILFFALIPYLKANDDEGPILYLFDTTLDEKIANIRWEIEEICTYLQRVQTKEHPLEDRRIEILNQELQRLLALKASSPSNCRA